MKQIAKLDKLIKTADEVIIATDDDREGEELMYICDLFSSNRNYKRIIFNEITKKAICDAMNQPTVLNMDSKSTTITTDT